MSKLKTLKKFDGQLLSVGPFSVEITGTAPERVDINEVSCGVYIYRPTRSSQNTILDGHQSPVLTQIAGEWFCVEYISTNRNNRVLNHKGRQATDQEIDMLEVSMGMQTTE